MQADELADPLAQQTLTIGLHGLDNIALKRQVLGPAGREPWRFIAAPDNGVCSGLKIRDPKAICGGSISREIQHPRTSGAHRGAN